MFVGLPGERRGPDTHLHVCHIAAWPKVGASQAPCVVGVEGHQPGALADRGPRSPLGPRLRARDVRHIHSY